MVDCFCKIVVELLMISFVIFDFWVEWCGLCKVLILVLEKVVVEYVDWGVIFVKVNVDEE